VKKSLLVFGRKMPIPSYRITDTNKIAVASFTQQLDFF